MAKGSGMIEPMMATMLGVRHDRRRGAAAAARPRAARGGRRHVQRHHRRRRVLDQRLRDAARQRRERRRRSTRRATTRSSQALTRRLPASSRSASCAAARARPSSSPSRSPARAISGGRAAGGEGDRQLAAGEDRHPRRRSQLGPADRRGRPRRRRVRAVARGGHDRIDRAVQGRPAVRRGGAGGGGVPEGQGHRP